MLSFLIVSPIQASDTVKAKIDAKADSPSSTSFSKRKKIKKINDLRIIVDISGSMKKTDPNNLRRSAVRLLAGLVPEGSRAGIWNFGKQVNMSVKIDTVNDAWRKLARAESKKISSAGLYTNIESVLRKASFDWRKPDPRYKRNIIILTDGHVDISKDAEINKASRKRILKEVLPTFENAQARIHTIALSDDVDEKLLSTLSAYSDGLFKKANNADDLQKLFLQMLEQSIKLDTLPIKDNKFSVDSSINDMTLLVFNKDKLRPTTIISPTNKKWTKATYPNKVKWFSDEGYDLITIKKPQKGEWKIQAPSDPSNRVVVATNLKLKLNDIPSYLILGDALNVSAHLEEDGKPLTNKQLLSKFKFVLSLDAEHSPEKIYPLTKSDGNDYSYSVEFADKFKEGNNEIVIQAKSPTAEREIHHQFKVYASLADVKILENTDKYKIEVKPHLNILRPNSIKINVELNDKSKHALIRHNETWLVDVDKSFKGSTFTITIYAQGADGKTISRSFEKVLSIHPTGLNLNLASKFEEQHKRETKHDTDVKNSPEAKKEKEGDKKDKAGLEYKDYKYEDKYKYKEEDNGEGISEEEDINWVFIISSIIIGNVLLAVVFGGGYVFMKRRKEKLIKDLGEEISSDIDVKNASSQEEKK